MTGREVLVNFLKKVRVELLRVREWSSTDIGLCSLVTKVYRENLGNSLTPDSDISNSGMDADYVIEYFRRRYKPETPSHEFWWPIALYTSDTNKPWAEEGRQSRLAFLNQAIADLESEIKEGL